MIRQYCENIGIVHFYSKIIQDNDSSQLQFFFTRHGRCSHKHFYRNILPSSVWLRCGEMTGWVFRAMQKKRCMQVGCCETTLQWCSGSVQGYLSLFQPNRFSGGQHTSDFSKTLLSRNSFFKPKSSVNTYHKNPVYSIVHGAQPNVLSWKVLKQVENDVSLLN